MLWAVDYNSDKYKECMAFFYELLGVKDAVGFVEWERHPKRTEQDILAIIKKAENSLKEFRTNDLHA